MARRVAQAEFSSNVWEQVRVTREVAAARAVKKPPQWEALARRYGFSARTLQRWVADFKRWDQTGALEVVSESVMLREQMLSDLGAIARDETATAASRVGALRAMMDADRERIELLQAAGKVPRNMARFRAEAEFAQIARELVAVLERHDVRGEVLEELHAVVRRHVPDHAENVRSIDTARSRS